LSYKIY